MHFVTQIKSEDKLRNLIQLRNLNVYEPDADRIMCKLFGLPASEQQNAVRNLGINTSELKQYLLILPH